MKSTVSVFSGFFGKPGLLILLAISFFVPNVGVSQSGVGLPAKFLSSCEADFDGDGNSDIALFVETLRGRELIVLLSRNNAYEASLVYKANIGMALNCIFGNNIFESKAGKSEGRRFNTPGVYLQLSQPEGAAISFFWNGKKFQEIWTKD